MKEVEIISKVVGRGGAGASVPSAGVSASVNLGAYALKSDVEALAKVVNEFLEGDDTDVVINKWTDLVAFLEGISEEYDLLSMLGLKADKATTLAGYGITDAYTKTNVDDLLKLYVTLATAQTITGEKNFTGGLKVNGSPIVYDATNKYWKLEGDLLVTGGVTMYGNDSEFVASTIMDALLLDDATLGINSEGQLYVKGGTGGGLTEVYWDDVKEKPTFATVATSGKYSDLSGVPTLLSSFTNDVGYLTSHQTIYNLTLQAGAFSAKTFDPNGAAMTVNIPTSTSHISEGSNLYFTNARAVSALSSTLSGYLPLSGGTLTGSLNLPLGVGHKIGSDLALWVTTNASSVLQLRASSSNKGGQLAFYWDTSWKGTLAATTGSVLIWNDNTIWHAGNDGAGSGLDADLLDGTHGNMFHKEFRGSIASASIDTYATRDGGNYAVTHDGYSGMLVHFPCNNIGSVSALDLYVPHYDFASYGLKARISVDTNRYTAWRTFAFTDSNVASATKLQTARTIWGQSFDGTGDVDGKIKLTDWDSDGVAIRFENAGKTSAYLSFYSAASNAYAVGQNGSRFLIAHNTYGDIFNVLNGNVLIGTTTDGGYKLDVNGNIRCGQVYYSDNFRYLAVGVGSDNAHYVNFGEYNKAYYTAINLNANGATRFLGADGSIKASVDHSSGNGLFSGGITMYSDIRKKTKLQDVELSLSQIANAPLIEHYYNSDSNKTTHVGSIAQYWAGLNDWFCKLDNDGYYTMEIQNAALASAISIARHLQKYESKTDRTIRKLKQRVSELEEEMEKLKSA